jgi:hypothetical protein
MPTSRSTGTVKNILENVHVKSLKSAERNFALLISEALVFINLKKTLPCIGLSFKKIFDSVESQRGWFKN